MEIAFRALLVEARRMNTGQKNQTTSILYVTNLPITPKASVQE